MYTAEWTGALGRERTCTSFERISRRHWICTWHTNVKVMNTCVRAYTGIHVWNGNLGNDRTTTSKTASVRKQLGTKNSKNNEDRRDNNGGVNGADYSGMQSYKGWRMTDYRRERQSYVIVTGGDEGGQGWDGRTVLREMWGRQEETREAKVEMGGLC